MGRPTSLRTALLLVGLPGVAAAQAGPPGGPPPTIPGTAIVRTGPVEADTLPILCHDAQQPDRGFITDRGDPVWSPTPSLDLWPTPGAPDSLTMRFDDGDTVYDRTFPLGTPMTGMFMAGVNIVPWDSGRGVDLYIGADCTRRLERGG